MKNSEIVSHIEAPLLTAGFVHVGSALSQNAMPRWDKVPAAFVHPLKDDALGENRVSSCAHSQVRMERFGVVIVCAIDDLEDWRVEVDKALLTPNPATGEWLPGRKHATNWVEGEIVDLTATQIWWRDTYSTKTERRFP